MLTICTLLPELSVFFFLTVVWLLLQNYFLVPYWVSYTAALVLNYFDSTVISQNYLRSADCLLQKRITRPINLWDKRVFLYIWDSLVLSNLYRVDNNIFHVNVFILIRKHGRIWSQVPFRVWKFLCFHLYGNSGLNTKIFFRQHGM